jgi:hypothetical protein
LVEPLVQKAGVANAPLRVTNPVVAQPLVPVGALLEPLVAQAGNVVAKVERLRVANS